MLATLAAPHPDPGHAVDRTAPFLWYTLRINAMSQIAVCSRARELGFSTYCPMKREPVTVRKRGRTQTLAQLISPLMPGYVFVSLPSASPRFDLFQPDSDSDRPDPLPPDARVGDVADQARPTVEPIRGCLGFVGSSEGPMPVHEAVIEDMRLREKNGEFDLTGLSEDGRYIVPRWVKRDERVEFIAGPFKGFHGTIVKAVGKSLLRVTTSIFGRQSDTNAPLDWVKRA